MILCRALSLPRTRGVDRAAVLECLFSIMKSADSSIPRADVSNSPARTMGLEALSRGRNRASTVDPFWFCCLGREKCH